MLLYLCPGVHAPQLTDAFLKQLLSALSPDFPVEWLIFPADRWPPYSPVHVLQHLSQHMSQHLSMLAAPRACASPSEQRSQWIQHSPPIIMIGFSAGVVGAMGAAIAWQALGGSIRALFALDGWGVPAIAPFPVHRLSHDAFTHYTSRLLGAGEEGFYADPAIDHLLLWQQPGQVTGWGIQQHQAEQTLFHNKSSARYQTTALTFLQTQIKHYGA